jgi:hypothetical protein
VEVVERDRIPRKQPREGRITRHVRLAGAPRETRLYGFRRIPRNLGGAVLGMLVLVVFFAGLAGDSLGFLLMLAAVVLVGAIFVWALAQTDLRARFDQRWRPRRKIAPLDTGSWRRLAVGLDAKMHEGGLPRITGGILGVAFELRFVRLRGARTLARAVLPEPVTARVEVRPRRARFSTRHDRATGDADFDASFRVTSRDPSAPAGLLTPVAKAWIVAVEPEVVLAQRREVRAWCRGFVEEDDRLRGLVELVAATARR